MRQFRSPKNVALLLLLLFLDPLRSEKVCEMTSEGKVCRDGAATCEMPESLCASSKSSSLYRFGGTAQAYKPNAPVKSEICDVNKYRNYKVATWPFSRSYSNAPLEMSLTVSLWSCAGKSSTSGGGFFSSSSTSSECCCQRLSTSSNATVEVWQARPDGSYASLRPGKQDGDCRAQKHLVAKKQDYVISPENSGSTSSKDKAAPSLTFDTLAPGSTGSMNGLGPNKFDTPPFGPPVMHIMASASRHLATLVDIPLLFNNLEPRSFFWPDWRGAAWVTRKPKDAATTAAGYTVTSSPSLQKDKVAVQVDVYLQQLPEGADDDEAIELCPSSWSYGLPSSFYTEPISVCAPSMLDFFEL